MKPISAKIITRPTARLLSLETVYRQCEVVAIDTDGNPDDDLLLGFLDAATDHAEKFTGRSLLIRTYEFALDAFPRTFCNPPGTLQPGIEVPYPPLIEIESFTFTDDSDGELEQDVDYLIDEYGDKAVLRPVSSWPSTLTPAPNRVKCRYRAGYQSEEDPDSDAEPLPGGIRAAVLIVLEDLYKNRGTLSPDAQFGAESLLRPWRVLLGMA
jgi:uncharacterized phiE125 gp8 family phage protein